MKKYSKLIGMAVGLLIGAAVSFGLLPEDMATAELQASILSILAAVGVYASPSNAE